MIGQSFKMAFSAIGQNKMRSFLTMLGIIIGVMAVVVLVSITQSATSSVTDEFNSMGANKLSVNIMNARNKTLTLKEVTSLPQEYESIAYAVPTITQSSTVKAGDTSDSYSVVGTTPQYLELNNLEVSQGRFLKTPDLDNSVAAAIIGSEVAEDLFGSAKGNIVGQTISVDGRNFKVVGVLKEAGTSIGSSTNSNIIIPYTVAQRMYSIKGVTAFSAMAKNSERVSTAEADLTQMLSTKFNDDEAYRIMNQSSMLESLSSISNTMAIMLGGIAGISLLVGGIGIMNIMLVSVTERTKEIGIKKAIGASRRRILSQFLIESLVLSTLGGLIGIGVSWVVLLVFSAGFGGNYTMSVDMALIATGFSLVIGLLFGISPANKAAKMPPIQALRTE